MKRKIIVWFAIILLVVFDASMIYGYWASSINGTSISLAASIPIGTWNQLSEDETLVDENVLVELLSGELETTEEDVLVLHQDIDLSNEEVNVFEPIVDFNATIEGNGHTISGFKIEESASSDSINDYDMTSIFLHNSGQINDLVVEDVNIVITDDTWVNNSDKVSVSAVLVGENEGVIKNAEVKKSKITVESIAYASRRGYSESYAAAAGLVGLNREDGIIENSYAQVDVVFNVSSYAYNRASAQTYVYAGGLVAQNEGEINHCYASGDVTTNISTFGNSYHSSTLRMGGLVGYQLGTIENSFAAGNLELNGSADEIYFGHVYGQSVYYATENNLYAVNDQTFSGLIGTPEDENYVIKVEKINLQSKTYLSSNLGFDFESIWIEKENDYPVLQS